MGKCKVIKAVCKKAAFSFVIGEFDIIKRGQFD